MQPIPTTSTTVGNHFSAGIPFRVHEGKLQFLVIGYREAGTTTTHIKFIGGTNTEYPDETETQTLIRELCGEAFDPAIKGPPKPTSARMVYEEKFAAKATKPAHTKRFYLLEPCDWNVTQGLRTEEKIDTQVGRADEHLSPPMWMDYEELVEKIFPKHAAALSRAYDKIMGDRALAHYVQEMNADSDTCR